MQTFQNLFEFHRKRFESQNECLVNCRTGPIWSGDVVVNPSDDHYYLMVGVMNNKATNRVEFMALRILFLDKPSGGMVETGLTNVKEQMSLLKIVEAPGINFCAGDIINRRINGSVSPAHAMKVSGFCRDGSGDISVMTDSGTFDHYDAYSYRLAVIKPAERHRVYGEIISADETAAERDALKARDSQDLALDGLPRWLKDMDDAFHADVSHVFCLSGNICDYQLVNGQVGDKPSVVEILFAKYFDFRYQIRYSISKGLLLQDDLIKTAFCAEYGDKLSPGQNSSLLSQELAKQKICGPLSESVGKTPDRVLPFLEHVFAPVPGMKPEENRKILIIDFAHDIFPATDNPTGDERASIETIIGWARDKRMSEAGHLIVLLTPSPSKLHSALRAADSGIRFLHLPKPDIAQRHAVWQRSLADSRVNLNGTLPKILAGATNGLACSQIDDIVKLAARRGDTLSLELVRHKKEEVLAQEFGGNLKIKMPQFGFENFGGKEYLKAYFRNINENLARGILRRVPMGVLVPGPPGTGKTCFLECFAKESGFTVVELGNLRSMFVGESENIASQVFDALDDLAPVIVIEDEADQSDSSRDSYQGDAGVSNRLRQMTFKFRSAEKRRGRVIWFSLTNRIDLIDEALKRKGRADEIIPFILPDSAEYASILSVMFRRYRIGTDFKQAQPFVEALAKLDYVTGADIEWMVLEADRLSSYEGATHVSAAHLMQAIESWVSPSNPREIDRQIVLALEKSSKQLRPPNWPEVLVRAKERQHLTIAI